MATCCLKLDKPEEVERVLLEGTGVLQKGPKDSRAEILADPCPIPFGAAGLRLLGEGLCKEQSSHAHTHTYVSKRIYVRSFVALHGSKA